MLMRSMFGLMVVGTVIGGGIAISGVSESREPLPTNRVANPMPAAKPNFILILGEGHGNSSLPFTQDPALPDARNTGVKMPAFEDVANNGMSHEEIERAKGAVRGSLVLSQEDSGSRMSRIGKNEIVYGQVMDFDEILKAISRVNATDIKEIASAFLTKTPTLALVGPFKSESKFEKVLSK